ncbi:MAG: response regulator [Verrucomicrobia bacterium]|nr:response regulator [Verrucomicrobiota bacterium]
MANILVIEDDELLRLTLEDRLLMEGFSVLTAADGAEGLRQAREQLPDLILCDIMMPVMDGYAVLQALQKETRTTRIPFVFLTASSDPLQIRAGLDLGATDYLCKPVPKTKLLTTIQHCLENQNPPGHEP